MRMIGRFLTVSVAAMAAQAPAPEPPGPDEKCIIEKKLTELASRVHKLTARKAEPALVAAVDLYRKAAAERDYIQMEPLDGKRETLPPYQETMLHYYDAVDYSLNAFNTPTVGYSGEIDAQPQASGQLPIRWSKTDIVGPQKFSAADHVPVLIYPNPLNPTRYLVINSVQTFGGADFAAPTRGSILGSVITPC